MNICFVKALLAKNRTGQLIKYIESNITKWSVNDCNELFKICVKNGTDTICLYILKYFIRKDCIDAHNSINTFAYDIIYDNDIVYYIIYNMLRVYKFMISKFGREISYGDDYHTWYATNVSEKGDMTMYFTQDTTFKVYPSSHMIQYQDDSNLIIELSYECYITDKKMLKYMFSDAIINKFEFHDHTDSIVNLIERLHKNKILHEDHYTEIYDAVKSDYMFCRWPRLAHYV